ncbi:MAG: methylamine utilization protein [Rhodospirillaceae bacterium]|nr:methylamine utilization protein [Rhodospirillaceae bacterium]
MGQGTGHMLCGMLAAGLLTFAGGARAGTLSTRVTTAEGTPVAEAVVIATPVGQTAPVQVKPGTKAVMVQEHKQFVPFVLPVQIGTTVAFPNRDPFRHQVYSFSPAKTFELKLYGNDAAPTVNTATFDKEGPVALGCNIHDNMLAYIYVVGTPHFSATGGDGEGTIAQLPAGSYAVRVWHPNQKAGQGDGGTVKIGAADTVQTTVKIELKRSRTQRKPGAVDETEY